MEYLGYNDTPETVSYEYYRPIHFLRLLDGFVHDCLLAGGIYLLRLSCFSQLLQKCIREIRNCVDRIACKLRIVSVYHSPRVREILKEEMTKPHLPLALSVTLRCPRPICMAIEPAYSYNAI